MAENLNEENKEENESSDIPEQTVMQPAIVYVGDANQDINDEIETSYLNYAMSVIVSRALPDVRDGLKPVHRRILFAMHEAGLRSNVKYRKSATIV